MEKIDLKKEFSEYYTASSKDIKIVTVPDWNYLMIDGKGDPNNSAEFTNAVEALYSLSYTIKFMLKRGPEAIDYGVMPLEGLWWADDMNDFIAGKTENWKWTIMVMQPDFINKEIVDKAMAGLIEKKNLIKLPEVRFQDMHEGLSAQIMHIGPYSGVSSTIQKLHDYIKEKGYVMNGKHREIYLNDMKRTAPEKLKTIIRQPIKRN
ncbi:MAG: GyrI-like domain-containing protein [Bacteroidota bacterium]|nr:GyrI-like domain-containing protein [Bacteroidota bacterium]